MLVSRDKVRSNDLSTPDHYPILLNLDVHSLHPPVIEPRRLLNHPLELLIIRHKRSSTFLRSALDAHNSGYDCDPRPLQLSRSEERRVGKECRSRWSPYH